MFVLPFICFGVFIQGDRKICGIHILKKLKIKYISLYVKFLFYDLNYICGLAFRAGNAHRAEQCKDILPSFMLLAT